MDNIKVSNLVAMNNVWERPSELNCFDNVYTSTEDRWTALGFKGMIGSSIAARLISSYYLLVTHYDSALLPQLTRTVKSVLSCAHSMRS